MLLKANIIDPNERGRGRRRKNKEDFEELRRIAIGFTAPESITNWQGAKLFFDLLGGGDGGADKALFFAAVSGCKITFHGHRLNTQLGIPENNLSLEDHLNENKRLQQNIRARYERHFITFTDTEIPEVEPIESRTFLNKWFEHPVHQDGAEQAKLDKLKEEMDVPMFWLEIEFNKSVAISQISSRLSIRFNVFPVANRRLNGHEKGKHYWLRNNSIKWVALKPEESFLSIRSVYEEKSSDNQVFQFKPFADFKDYGNKASYTIRYGGVGRWDDFNAWQRLAYVVDVLQENYKLNELIEQAAAALSLEDIHHLLGKKISKTAQEEKPTKDIYVLLHAGMSTGIRVRVEYWTSIGAAANRIPSKSHLKCISKDKTSFETDSIELITGTVDGKDPLNSTQQLEAMKSTLLSRERIVTREDVKVFCKKFLTNKLADIQVVDGIGNSSSI